MHDIPGYDSFVKIEPLNKGWSGDKKYLIETTNGAKLLLRIFVIDALERKKSEYGKLKRAAALDINFSAVSCMTFRNNAKPAATQYFASSSMDCFIVKSSD
ncbi:MAG: hypothetical protein FWE82_00395 [Defluviitaleaceae bacterium]|nr:hypothetical protein [Defluviitaleaceae bacterium]